MAKGNEDAGPPGAIMGRNVENPVTCANRSGLHELQIRGELTKLSLPLGAGTLLGPQRDERVDTRCPPRRDEACGDRQQRENRGRASKRRRIGRLNFK